MSVVSMGVVLKKPTLILVIVAAVPGAPQDLCAGATRTPCQLSIVRSTSELDTIGTAFMMQGSVNRFSRMGRLLTLRLCLQAPTLQSVSGVVCCWQLGTNSKLTCQKTEESRSFPSILAY